MPARRRRHNFLSMTSEMAGKCAFPRATEPRRSKILVPLQGTGEWLAAPDPRKRPGEMAEESHVHWREPSDYGSRKRARMAPRVRNDASARGTRRMHREIVMAKEGGAVCSTGNRANGARNSMD